MILISPSQISTFILCNARWGWDKIDKVPRAPATKAMIFGTKAHKILEVYGRTGRTPRYDLVEGPWERAAFKVFKQGRIKTARPGVFHEGIGEHRAPNTDDKGKFTLPIPHVSQDLAFHGFIDYMDASDPANVFVRDYKFQSPITPLKDLSKDAQALIYSYYAFSVFPKCEQVIFSHEIGRKTNPPSYECNEIVFRRAGPTFCIGMDFIFRVTATMVESLKQPTAFNLEKNIKSCWAFNKRCEFHGRCFPEDKEETVVFYG